MKVKNIMFAGFAAAIFASVAGAANAAPTYELASKQYVDAKHSDALTQAEGYADSALADATAAAETLVADEISKLDNEAEEVGVNDGMYVTNVTQTDGKIKQQVVGFDGTITDSSTNAPQTLAVKAYVDNAVAGGVGAIDIAEAQAGEGKYFSSIAVDDGQFSVGEKSFETKISAENETSLNAPSTAAVAYLVNATKTALENDAQTKADAAQAAAEATAAADATSKANAAQAAAEATAKAYTDAEIEKVNSGAAWLDKTADQKGDYIVRVDESGNESLINVVVVDANGDAIYPAPAAN